MRFRAALALTCSIGLCTAAAQSKLDSESNIACIERLRIPNYPRLADAARVAGSVTATVTLASDGSIQGTVLDMGLSESKLYLFGPAVEEALRASAFRKSCGGKAIKLIFNFVLSEELRPTISFAYPNDFEIGVAAKIVGQ